MQQRIRLFLSCIIVAALLPASTWGYGGSYYHADRDYRPYTGPAGGQRYSGRMKVQTVRTADGYNIRVYLDGIRPKDVQVVQRHNRLILNIERGGRHGPGRDARGTSRWQMRMRRELQLPHDADWTQLSITTRNGMMEIHIPARR